MESVDVMLSGRVLPGTDPNRAGADLARISGLDFNTALAAITSGQPRPALQGLTPEHGLAWLARMNAIGIEASLQTSTVPAAKSFGPPPETPTQAQVPSQPASRQAGTDSGHWLDKARKVPAGHGKFWIRDSWRLVRERPGVWIAVLLMLEGFICVSCLIDFGGRRFVPQSWFDEFGLWFRCVFAVAEGYLFYIFPLFLGGVALMAHRQLAGEEIRFADLADCCKGEGAWRLYALCGYAFLYTLAFYVLEYGIDLNDGWVLSWLAFLGMAGITAPTLCALGGKQASTAILDGIGGAFRNWRALLVFVLFWFPLCFFFSLPVVTFQQLRNELITDTSSLWYRVVAWEVGEFSFSIWIGLCIFLFCLVGYLATRDMFYEE